MKHKSALTLIEIMVVVVIIGLLASFIIPNIMGRPDEARLVKVKQDINTLNSALDLYRLDNGLYPSTDQGLQALVSKPNSQPIPRNWQQYMNLTPKDPWGNDYQYLNPGIHLDIDIFSYGANGIEGGEGINQTIGNWSET